jgi:hypothetical protein
MPMREQKVSIAADRRHENILAAYKHAALAIPVLASAPHFNHNRLCQTESGHKRIICRGPERFVAKMSRFVDVTITVRCSDAWSILGFLKGKPEKPKIHRKFFL